MKKIASLLLTAVMLATMLSVPALPAAAAALPKTVTIEFSTDGPDTYSDGSSVLDGETYVIVWTGSPDTKVNLDKTFESDDDVKVLVYAPMAEKGQCPPIFFRLYENYYTENGFANGYFRLFSTNVLRREGNSTIPFEIRETKSTVTKTDGKVYNNSSAVVPPGTAPNIISGGPAPLPNVDSDIPAYLPGYKFDDIKIVGDWVLIHALGLSEKQAETAFIIEPKVENMTILEGVVNSSVLSVGDIWIVVAVAIVAAAGVAALVIVKKKKKTER